MSPSKKSDSFTKRVFEVIRSLLITTWPPSISLCASFGVPSFAFVYQKQKKSSQNLEEKKSVQRNLRWQPKTEKSMCGE